ncbi:hypothetical protein [Oceaniovalibus sp. ACAM 378]|jgi:hypothetical protein|uniref:hypothetical protein n=1 Tax=Oceaniovalibus sp. ACAM 378 TaxID=2599923 RepID=UPI0016521238|nr:hypothetical protein [Oceaniovalibus sp. ACAM 378]
MTKLAMIVILGVFSALAGCTDPDHYPISGQECGPNDPVLDMDASDCVLPV